ncbi:MAG: hypothetical protein AAB510_03245 [Patescibacteria group bacterium]
MKKILTYIFIIILVGSFFSVKDINASATNPNEPCTFDNFVTTVPNNSPCKNQNFEPGTNKPLPTDTSYKFLQPLPGTDGKLLTSFDPEDPNALSKYLNLGMQLFIGICAVLAVVMIVMGGMEYMTSELPGNKADGLEKIQHAILGLLLALGSWVILYQINPDLLNLDIGIEETTLTVEIKEFDIRKEANYEQNRINEANRRGNFNGQPATKGDCSIAKMQEAGFSNPTQASCVCQGESSGLNQPSRTDICADGSSASIGLFQINIVAHADEIPACRGVFTGKFTAGNKSCRADGPNGGREGYLRCANYVNNPAVNIAFAQKLLSEQRGRWYPTWGAARKCNF